MTSRKAYINTFGCQMNVYDTNRMRNMLFAIGYESVDSFWRADLIIVNTCAIREKAVQKVHSFLGRVCGIKRRKPGMRIAVTGCVAQQQSQWLADRFEGVDLILGTHAVNRLPQYLEALEARGRAGETGALIDVTMTTGIDMPGEDDTPPVQAEPADISSFVTIMRGCDNFCTYCVVPYVRGRETSRTPERIVAEVESLVRAGAREVTLLGQNVNSYGLKEGLCGFSALLEQINATEGLGRIRFVTSHPKDLSDELISAFADLPKLANHIHLPVQSGSNAVLSRMNRKYTRDIYMRRIDKLRSARPGIAITTDFIAGFPGETEADFEDTLDLIRQVRFDTLFAFEYSDRPEAPASRFADKLETGEKKRRLREILETQSGITAQIYEDLVGTAQVVLVEGKSRKPRNTEQETGTSTIEMSGRSSENRIVNFIPPETVPSIGHAGDSGAVQPESLVGRLMEVYIERACANSLWGRSVPDTWGLGPAASVQIKGGKTNAA